MNEDKLLEAVWRRTILEFTKEWYISEDELKRLKEIFKRNFLAVADIDLKEGIDYE